jgi:hypothetical protein
VTATLNRDLRLRVSGSNWTPRDRVTISLSDNPDGADAVELDRVRVGANGRFNFNTRLQQAPSGPLYVVVEDTRGERVIAPVIQQR